MDIHKTAIVLPGAEISKGVTIGPYSTIGENVKIGKDTKIHNHVSIKGWTEIGENCQIFPFASIGTICQDLKYKGEKTLLKIGNNNVIREFVTLNMGTVNGRGETVIGHNNFLMAYAHIAHDCIIGNDVIMANAATLGGHVVIEDFAIIGGLSAIHQFVNIGCYAMVGGASAVAQDVPPYLSVAGNRAKLYGLNTLGLKRHNFSKESIQNIKRAYKIIFQSKLTLKKAIEKVKEEIKDSKEANHLLTFIENSKRGICR